MDDLPRRKAVRRTEVFTYEYKVQKRKYHFRWPFSRFRFVGIATVLLFILVSWIGAEVVYTSTKPYIVKGFATLSMVQLTRIARGIPTISPTWTPSPTPTPTVTPTATPVPLPAPPKWFTEKHLIRCAGIVAGETWSITDTKTLDFLATQIMYDYVKYKGKLPTNRWKGYDTPTHETLQACNVAVMTYDEPLWSKCDYVGGYSDTAYFQRVSTYRAPDYSFGAGMHVVLGWGCIPKEVKEQ